MTDLLVHDVDDEIVRRLEARAAQHGHSAEAGLRTILGNVLLSDKESFIALAKRLQAENRGRATTDSAELIRADRNRDGAPW